jgi:hypothetical protein
MLVRKFFSSKVMIYAARLGGVIREVLQKRPFPKLIDSILCHPVNPEDTNLDSIGKKYGPEYPITIVRDRLYRVWRYQHAPGPVPAMWLVTDNQDELQAWFSLRVKIRGKTPINVCELLDIFGPMREMEFQRHVLA